MTGLVEAFERQSRGCRESSPLYATICAHVAGQIGRGSVHERVLEPYADDPLASMVALRFLGAVHRLVLSGLAPELAAHYPSVEGSPGPGLVDAFDRTVEEFADELTVGTREPVQTNEVARAASLIGGFVTVTEQFGLPLRLLEIGASAGLLMLWDRFRYETPDGEALGPADSPVRLAGPWISAPPLSPAPVVFERRGCDQHPVDASSEDGRLRLRGFLWPDQVERRSRLDAALRIAEEEPVVVEQADAGAWLESQLLDLPDGVATVVHHSIVLQYLSDDSLARMEAALGQAAARTTPRSPLAHLRMEPGGPVAEVRLQTWPDGTDEPVATSGYHGQTVEWRLNRRRSNNRGTP